MPICSPQGVQHLAADRHERLEVQTNIDVPLAELLEIAERLACFCLLSGRETIDLGDWPRPSSLGRLELEGFPGGSEPAKRQPIMCRWQKWALR